MCICRYACVYVPHRRQYVSADRDETSHTYLGSVLVKSRPRLRSAIAVIIIIIIFITSAALSKIRRAAGTCYSVLTKRCAFRRRAKVAVDSVDRRSSAGKLIQVSGPETAKFLRPMAVAVRCTSSLPEA